MEGVCGGKARQMLPASAAGGLDGHVSCVMAAVELLFIIFLFCAVWLLAREVARSVDEIFVYPATHSRAHNVTRPRRTNVKIIDRLQDCRTRRSSGTTKAAKGSLQLHSHRKAPSANASKTAKTQENLCSLTRVSMKLAPCSGSLFSPAKLYFTQSRGWQTSVNFHKAYLRHSRPCHAV